MMPFKEAAGTIDTSRITTGSGEVLPGADTAALHGTQRDGRGSTR